jgi:hypothetical protein
MWVLILRLFLLEICAVHESGSGPSVWTGRALQAENGDLENCWSCASVSGLLMERSAPGHHGYPRALDLIRVSAPKAIWAT